MQPGTAAPPKSSEKPHVTTHKTASETSDATNDGNYVDEKEDAIETTTKRHRVAFTRGLSKYGPWGYLILGMLLCGGALLLCVLWGKHISELNFNRIYSHLSRFPCHIELLSHSLTHILHILFLYLYLYPPFYFFIRIGSHLSEFPFFTFQLHRNLL